MNKPVLFQRPFIRLACSLFPWIVPPRLRGPTKREHWESYSTDNFNELDPASVVLMEEVMALAPDKNASLIDLGCNVGRHLNYLYQAGWHHLTGVDFSARAIEDMSVRYPELHRGIKTVAASFQEFLPKCEDSFDIVYSRGATFELVPPSFPLIRHVCRIAKTYVVIVIAEAGHAYPRYWEYEFARQGFELVHLKRPPAPESPDQQHLSLMTFKRLV